MRNYPKVGKRPGKPAYRTPVSFRVRQAIKSSHYKLNKHRPR